MLTWLITSSSWKPILKLKHLAGNVHKKIFSKSHEPHVSPTKPTTNNFEFDNAISAIEDDGYSISHKLSPMRKLWKRTFNKVEPGVLILVRHGETVLNYNKTFTGWIDTDISERGIKETEHAANLLLERGYSVDVTYTSRLKRAIRSSWIMVSDTTTKSHPALIYRLDTHLLFSLHRFATVNWVESVIQTCLQKLEAQRTNVRRFRGQVQA